MCKQGHIQIISFKKNAKIKKRHAKDLDLTKEIIRTSKEYWNKNLMKKKTRR